MSLLAELKRRNVIRMAGLYLVGAWLITQVAGTVMPMFGAPDWVARSVVILLALGFVPMLVFSWVFEWTPDGLKRDGQVPIEHSIAPETARRLDQLTLAGLLAVVALVAADRYWPREASVPDSTTVATSSPHATDEKTEPVATSTEVDSASLPSEPPPQKSIAVLAFANMSADKDNEYFSDGISEEILNALAKIDDLKVAGRTSSFHFKGTKKSLADIGKALGVAHVLEGSVRKQGEKVRITAQLIQVRDGYHLWSETYDGDLKDVFELQERIARAITDELKVVLQGGQTERLVHAGTANTEAYALYLQATAVFNRREGPRFAEAIAQLEQAIALDPGFARAYSRLATLHAVASNYTSVDFLASQTAMENYARRASEIDPSLAEPHAALALSINDQRRFGEARAAFDRALALDPDDVTVNFWQGVALSSTGYGRQSKAAFDRALAIDPMLPNALVWRARIHVADGELEQAERLLRRAEDGGHSFVGLGFSWLEFARGNRTAATEQLTRGLKYFSTDFPPQAPSLFARASLGDAEAKTQALALIDAYLATKPATIAGIVPYVLIRSGEVARGFAVMQERPTSNDSLVSGEIFRDLIRGQRRAPEFAEFARRMGWAVLWDEFGPPDLCRKVQNGDYVCE